MAEKSQVRGVPGNAAAALYNFGSALLEAANAAGLDTRPIIRMGLPDRFIEHGERSELLVELGLDVEGICRTIRKALTRSDDQSDIKITNNTQVASSAG